MTTCPVCGTHVRAARCPHCDAPVDARPSSGRTVALLGLVVGLVGAPGCESKDQALYGVAVQDLDGDGYVEPEDCDDGDATIFPDAEEIPGDGIDSNCNDDDDT